MRARSNECGPSATLPGRRAVLLVVAMLSAAWPAARVEADIAPITKCSLQVETLDSTTGTQYATATLVHEVSGFYVLTAYHVIYLKSDVSVNFGGDGKVSVADTFYFEPKYYYNTVLDLAIFKLTDKGVRDLGLRAPSLSNDRGTVRAIEIYPGTVTSVLDRVAKGASASAVGNPQIQVESVLYVPKNIVYSCTISDFEQAKDRLKAFIRARENDDRDMALDNELMFLETFSITRGFSGGPVIVSTNNFEDGQLAGIVVGGSPMLFSGRFSWACDAKKIKVILRDWDAAPEGGARKPAGWRKLPFPTRLEDWPRSPYELRNAYSFDEQRKYTRPFKGPRDGEEIFLNDEGYELVFDTCTFENTNFAGAYLSGARFQDCTFLNVNFDDSILTGATFANCQFTGRRTFTPLLLAGLDETGDGMPSGPDDWKARKGISGGVAAAGPRPRAGSAAPGSAAPAPPAPTSVYVSDPKDADPLSPIFESIYKQKAIPAPPAPPAPPPF